MSNGLKRSLSDLELSRSKQLKLDTGLENMILALNNAELLNRILRKFFKQRLRALRALEDSKKTVPFDWLGWQLLIAFHRPGNLWENCELDNDLIDDWMSFADGRYKRYMRLTGPELEFLDVTLDNTWDNRDDRNLFKHLGSITREGGLRTGAKLCRIGCGGYNHCSSEGASPLKFAAKERNIPVFRRVLDSRFFMSTLADILRDIETAAKRVVPIPTSFLVTMSKHRVVLPGEACDLAIALNNCLIFDLYATASWSPKAQAEGLLAYDIAQFKQALWVIFDERNLDFRFWTAGNMDFVPETLPDDPE